MNLSRKQAYLMLINFIIEIVSKKIVITRIIT